MLTPMWNRPGVEEAAGEQPVPLAFGDRGPEEPKSRSDEAYSAQAAATAGDLGEEGERR